MSRASTRASSSTCASPRGWRACPTTRLASGFLTGKYRPGGPEVESAAGGVGARSTSTAAGSSPPRRGRRCPPTTVAAVALAWLRAQPGVIGADRERPHAGAARRAPADGRPRAPPGRAGSPHERPRGGIGGPSREQGRAPPARRRRGHERASRLARLPPACDRRASSPGIGTQVTLVALPYQVFVLTRSSFLVGLIGLVELVPLVGRRAARRHARRPHGPPPAPARLASSCRPRPRSCLVIGAAAGSPPVAMLYRIAAFAAGASAVDRPTRAAMVPALVGPERLRSAISFNYGLVQVAGRRAGTRRRSSSPPPASTGHTPIDVATFVAMIAAV